MVNGTPYPLSPEVESLAEELSLAMINIFDETGTSPIGGAAGAAVGGNGEEVRDMVTKVSMTSVF